MCSVVVPELPTRDEVCESRYVQTSSYDMMVVALDYRFKPEGFLRWGVVVVLTDSATVPGLSSKKLADG
jgi:hypothetical protein